MISYWLFRIQYQINLSTRGACLGQCLNLNEEHLISIHRGPNSFQHLLAYQNEFDPQSELIQNVLHLNLHTTFKLATKTLSIMEDVVSKTSNPQSKVNLSQRLSLIVVIPDCCSLIFLDTLLVSNKQTPELPPVHAADMAWQSQMVLITSLHLRASLPTLQNCGVGRTLKAFGLFLQSKSQGRGQCTE